MQVTVQNAPGSSYPGCEETNSCFLPFVAEIGIDGTVTWENVDAFAHTVTSGTPESGPDGHFDSSLIMVGQSYSYTARHCRNIRLLLHGSSMDARTSGCRRIPR